MLNVINLVIFGMVFYVDRYRGVSNLTIPMCYVFLLPPTLEGCGYVFHSFISFDMPKIYGKLICTSRQLEPQACDENSRPLNASLIPTLGAANFKCPNSVRIVDDLWDAVQTGDELIFEVSEAPATYVKRNGEVVTEDQLSCHIWTKNLKLSEKWLEQNFEALADGKVTFGTVAGGAEAKIASVNAKAEAIRKALAAAAGGGTAPVAPSINAAEPPVVIPPGG
jgi:hypothetical protein